VNSVHIVCFFKVIQGSAESFMQISVYSPEFRGY